MKKTLLLLLAVVAPLAVVAAAPNAGFAARSRGGDGPHQEVRKQIESFRRETPLSAAQRKQVGEILQRHRGEIQTQLAVRRAAAEQLRRATEQSSAGDADLPAAAGRMAESARSGALLRAKLAREIRPVLTPEQRRRLDEFSAGAGKMAPAP